MLHFLVALVALLACSNSSSVTSIGTDDAGNPPDTADTVTLADAQLQVVSGDTQESTVGSYLPDPLVVQVVDPDGNSIAGAPVEWVFYQGLGKQGEGQSAKTILTSTDQSGMASIDWQMGPRAGAQTASAEIPSAPNPTAGSDGPSLAPDNNNGKKVGFEAKAKPGDISSITVTPSETTLEVGTTKKLDAYAVDHFGNTIDGLSFQWRSSNEAVVQLANDGTADAIQDGSASATAKYKSVEGSSLVIATSTAENLAPSASILQPAGNTTIMLGDTMRFEASASDSDGSVASHAWDFGDGNGASVEDPGDYVYTAEGSYNVTYQVTDDQGATSGTETRTIQVTSEINSPPTAAIVRPAADTTVTLGDALSFEGSASDTDGTVTAHAWSFGDGNGASTQNPSHTYEAEGSYSVSYRTTDDDGALSTTATRSVVVEASGTDDGSSSVLTATAYNPSDSVAIFVTSAYSGSGSHRATIVQVDEFEGDWSTLAYADTVESNDLTTYTTTAGSLSADLYKARFKHVDENGESEWSDSVQFVIPNWASDWGYATGTNANALFDGPSGSRKWDTCSGSNCTSDERKATVTSMPNSNPHPNTFREQYGCQYNGGCGDNWGSARMQHTSPRWPEFAAVGDTMWHRYCVRYNWDESQSNQHAHHIHAESVNEQAKIIQSAIGGGQPGDSVEITLEAHRGGGPHFRTNFPGDNTLWYVENEYILTHADSAWFGRVTIRDSIGNIVKTGADWTTGDSDPNCNTITDSSGCKQIGLGGMGTDAFTRLDVGNNDPSGDFTGADSFLYWGCYAVSMDGPMGLHSPPPGS